MTEPFKVPLVIYQGATLNEVFTWKAGKPAVPVNLTGCTARMQVRATIDATAVLLELTSALGGILLGGVNGEITLFMNDTDTAAIDWFTGVYDLELTHSNGHVRRLMFGPVTVSKEVTREP